MQTWTIAVSKDPDYLHPGNSPWTKVVEMAGEDNIPGLIITHYKEPLICIPFYAYNGEFKKNHRMTAVIRIPEWVDIIKGVNHDSI